MKISVLIIAHNEEKHIVECLHSITHQTLKPQEIIVIAHNCTDRTIEYTEKFPDVKVVIYNSEEKGPLYARIRGFQEVRGDLVACIDGDGVAHKDWLQELTKPFSHTNIVATGGYVGFFEESKIFSISFLFFTLKIWRPWYFWGANFCVRSSAFHKMGGFTLLEKSWKEIGLTCPAEDYYLSTLLGYMGKVVYTPKASVYCYFGEFFQNESIERDMSGDRRKLKKWLHSQYISSLTEVP